MPRSSQASLTPPPARALLPLQRIATVALLAIVLGFVMQGLILSARMASGGAFPGHLFLVEIAQGVTWSVLVCLGVAVGISLGRVRTFLAGVMAAIFAPLAVAAAKASQKVMAGLIGAGEQQALLSVAMVSTLRAVEYGVLGWLLARLAQRDDASPLPYLATGAAIGVVFGGTVVMLNHNAALSAGLSPALPQIVGGIVNEVGFPIGCALVIYAGRLIGYASSADISGDGRR